MKSGSIMSYLAKDACEDFTKHISKLSVTLIAVWLFHQIILLFVITTTEGPPLSSIDWTMEANTNDIELKSFQVHLLSAPTKHMWCQQHKQRVKRFLENNFPGPWKCFCFEDDGFNVTTGEFLVKCLIFNRKFLLSVCDVPEPEDRFSMDEYSELLIVNKPIIYISVSELLNTHKVRRPQAWSSLWTRIWIRLFAPCLQMCSHCPCVFFFSCCWNIRRFCVQTCQTPWDCCWETWDLSPPCRNSLVLQLILLLYYLYW